MRTFPNVPQSFKEGRERLGNSWRANVNAGEFQIIRKNETVIIDDHDC